MTDQGEPKSNPANADNGSAFDEDIAVVDRFNEAHQGIMGMLFAAYKMRGHDLRAAKASVPLTIIGGFLGSGKTTLLNHLLAEPHARRLVVLVNDFGSINIDAALVASQTEDMISLSNGCACCAVSADLTKSLIKIAEREELPDAIVLEASGIAEPYGIVTTALTNPAIRLDGSIVVVDAENLQTLADDPLTSRLFKNQIAAADLILLSKIDLVDENQRALSRDWLATHYPNKRVVEAVDGNVPAEIVLGIQSSYPPLLKNPQPTDHAHDFESVSVTIADPLDGDRLKTLFASLPKRFLRANGVLNLLEEPERRTVYQRVGTRWSYTTEEPWGDEEPLSSLVFVGPAGQLDQSTIERDLHACIAAGGDVENQRRHEPMPMIERRRKP